LGINGGNKSSRLPFVYKRPFRPDNQKLDGNVKATIDEVRIYSRALGVSEIQADMNRALGRPGAAHEPAHDW
jgi:hypothetical protein